MSKNEKKSSAKNSEVSDMSSSTMDNLTYPKIDFKQLLKNKKTTIVSSEEALKDVTPIDWSDDVLSGKKKIIIDCDEK